MNRRDFIKASAAAVLTTGGVFLLGSRHSLSARRPANLNTLWPKNFRVSGDPSRPILSAVKSKDYRLATALALTPLGGIEAFIKKGDKVCIKPNIGWDRTAEQGANTHPLIVAELASLCFKAGAARVWVADVTCNAAERTYNRSGIKAAAEAEGARVIMPDDSQLVEVDFGGDSLGRWPVLRPILEADKLINVPVIKHHGLANATGALKNWFGAISGPRNRLHQDIENSVAELGLLFQPTLTVVDATRVLQRNGPQGGRIDDLIIHDFVFASTDQVAAEAYAVRFLNRKPEDFPFIRIAQEKGVGRMDWPSEKLVFAEA